jgi:N-acetylmuramoyl-L-alanine amidase
MKYKEIKEVRYLVIHCSATRSDQDFHAEDIARWHRMRGWLTIGYHYVITRDGLVEEGRPRNTPGAHARGYNHISLGICLIGGIDDNGKPDFNYTPAQMKTLKALLTQLEPVFPDAKVLGHRDLPEVNKACPCFDVIDWWDDYKPVKENKE